MKYQIKNIAIWAIIIIFSISCPHPASAEDFNFLTWMTGDSLDDGFYYIANGHGDVNGDGFEDVLIGGHEGSDTGYARLYFGGSEFDTIPDLVFYGSPGMGSYIDPGFGAGCAIIGDVNNDGFDDFIIGDPQKRVFYPGAGKAYLYFGGVEIDTIPDMVFEGEYWYYFLGRNVSAAGDVNGDGYDDWLINALFDDWYAFGRIYLYYGGEHPDGICDVFFIGDTMSYLFFNKPNLGDINGDGFDDLIFNKAMPIVCEIHLGAENMDDIPDIVFELGIQGSRIGDVNDDGFNDWIYFRNEYQVCFGSAELDTASDLTITTEPPCSALQASYSGGDINGDGIDDIVMGAYIAGGDGHGQVVGYSGGSDIDSLRDYFYDSGIEDAWLGWTTGLADLDGDGILEVLGGGWLSSQGTWSSQGRVWVLEAPTLNIADNGKIIPEYYTTLECYPNPFNPSTTLTFELASDGNVSLTIHDITGSEVAKLINSYKVKGLHEVTFDASELSSGIYFCRLTTSEGVKNRKLIYLK